MPYKNKEDRLASQRRHRKARPDLYNAAQKRHRLRVRAKVLDHYGRACACCGETIEQFLTLDHINNDGAEQRRKVKKCGAEFYRWVVANDFPDDLQLLCWNCNCAKGNYGKCPHEDMD